VPQAIGRSVEDAVLARTQYELSQLTARRRRAVDRVRELTDIGPGIRQRWYDGALPRLGKLHETRTLAIRLEIG
jgi:hypothetical protein